MLAHYKRRVTSFLARFSALHKVTLLVVLVLGATFIKSSSRENCSTEDILEEYGEYREVVVRKGNGVSLDLEIVGNNTRDILSSLGIYMARNSGLWLRRYCDRRSKFRTASVTTDLLGNATLYVYDDVDDDGNGYFVDAAAGSVGGGGSGGERGGLHHGGEVPLRKRVKGEIERFLLLSKELPLIDLGANVGLVSILAAMQGREVIAVEPVRETAGRLCRSVLDFGLASRVHVVRNAVSSSEGIVTMATESSRHGSRYEISRESGWGYGHTQSFSILTDSLLEIIPFPSAAMKIDVESHEGHVIAGAKRLFQKVDIPIVWMEWKNVKKIRGTYGPEPILKFMKERGYSPYELMTGKPLEANDHMTKWPQTVLWVKEGTQLKW